VTNRPHVQSPLLLQDAQILHAFSTRQGGVSAPPFASLNLGMSVGDERAQVEENRRRFFGGLGVDAAQVVRVYQAHGNGVLCVDDAVTRQAGFPESLVDRARTFDALVTNRPGLALTVSTADCVPILIHDPVRRAIAAVHAGWRGTAGRIVATALAALREAYGTDPADCRAAIGPCIRACCFEVDAPVVEAMASALADWETHATATRPGHWQLDLAGINRALLERAGMRPGNIADLGLCTSCRTDLFFSHRRDKGRTGRLMNFILLR
jgi:polyphenol oxidase